MSEHDRLLELCKAEDASEYQQLARFIMETKSVSAKERVLEGIREALDEAYHRMQYAVAEYEALGAHEEAKRAAAIRKSIIALYMERW